MGGNPHVAQAYTRPRESDASKSVVHDGEGIEFKRDVDVNRLECIENRTRNSDLDVVHSSDCQYLLTYSGLTYSDLTVVRGVVHFLELVDLGEDVIEELVGERVFRGWDKGGSGADKVGDVGFVVSQCREEHTEGGSGRVAFVCYWHCHGTGV